MVPLLEEIRASREAFNPENMTVMRNTVEELKSLMTEVRSLLDQEVNKPVVHACLPVGRAGWRKKLSKRFEEVERG